MIFLIVFIVLLLIGLFIFWILMLIDAAKRKFKNDNDRVIWILIIALLNWIGALIYYFAVKMHDRR